MMLLRYSLPVVLATLLCACGSDPKLVTSGGALLELIDIPNDPLLGCNDLTVLTLATLGDQGPTDYKQYNDGIDGASVSCSITGNKYSFNISRGRLLFSARGTFSGDTSTDALVSIGGGSGTLYASNATEPCKIKFTKREGGKVEGKVSCESLTSPSSASLVCALPSREDQVNLFAFTNCQM